MSHKINVNAKIVWFPFNLMKKEEFCKCCSFHNDVLLIHTELEDGTSKDYCPKCQELFGEKI